MPQRPEQARDAVERLLRHWGAEEAQIGLTVPTMPVDEPSPASRRLSLWRWAPLGAAAAVLLAASGLFVASRTPGRAEQALGPSPDWMAQLTALRIELGQAGQEIEGLRGELTQVRRELAAQQRLAGQKLDRLRRTLHEQHAAALAEANTTIETLRRGGDDLRDELAAARDARRRREEQLAALNIRRAQEHEQAAAAHGAMKEQLDRLERAARASNAAIGDVRQQLRSARQQRIAIRRTMQQVFLSAHAPGETGLRARQVAARHARLIARCARLRPDVSGDAVRRLVEQAEAVLTRLDLLRTSDRREAAAFGRRLRDTDLVTRIETELAEGRQAPAVQAWLLEAQLVLMGIDDAR